MKNTNCKELIWVIIIIIILSDIRDVTYFIILVLYKQICH